MAALGRETAAGDFEVEEVCFAGLGAQPPLPTERKRAYVCLVSGLNIDKEAGVRLYSRLNHFNKSLRHILVSAPKRLKRRENGFRTVIGSWPMMSNARGWL